MSMEKEKNMKEVMVEGHPVPLADLHQLFKQLTEVNLTKEELHTVLEEIISTSCPGLPTLVSEKLSIGIAESCFEVNTGYYDYGSGHIIMKLLQIISSFRVFAAILLVHIKAIDPISEDIKEISKNVPRYSQAECSIEKYHFLNSVHKQGFEIIFPQEIHDKILATILHVLKEKGECAHKEVIDSIVLLLDEGFLRPDNIRPWNFEISKTRLRAILSLLKSSSIVITNQDVSPVGLRLSSSISTFLDLRELHDKFILEELIFGSKIYMKTRWLDILWPLNKDLVSFQLEEIQFYTERMKPALNKLQKKAARRVPTEASTTAKEESAVNESGNSNTCQHTGQRPLQSMQPYTQQEECQRDNKDTLMKRHWDTQRLYYESRGMIPQDVYCRYSHNPHVQSLPPPPPPPQLNVPPQSSYPTVSGWQNDRSPARIIQSCSTENFAKSSSRSPVEKECSSAPPGFGSKKCFDASAKPFVPTSHIYNRDNFQIRGKSSRSQETAQGKLIYQSPDNTQHQSIISSSLAPLHHREIDEWTKVKQFQNPGSISIKTDPLPRCSEGKESGKLRKDQCDANKKQEFNNTTNLDLATTSCESESSLSRNLSQGSCQIATSASADDATYISQSQKAAHKSSFDTVVLGQLKETLTDNTPAIRGSNLHIDYDKLSAEESEYISLNDQLTNSPRLHTPFSNSIFSLPLKTWSSNDSTSTEDTDFGGGFYRISNNIADSLFNNKMPLRGNNMTTDFNSCVDQHLQSNAIGGKEFTGVEMNMTVGEKERNHARDHYSIGRTSLSDAAEFSIDNEEASGYPVDSWEMDMHDNDNTICGYNKQLEVEPKYGVYRARRRNCTSDFPLSHRQLEKLVKYSHNFSPEPYFVHHTGHESMPSTKSRVDNVNRPRSEWRGHALGNDEQFQYESAPNPLSPFEVMIPHQSSLASRHLSLVPYYTTVTTHWGHIDRSSQASQFSLRSDMSDITQNQDSHEQYAPCFQFNRNQHSSGHVSSNDFGLGDAMFDRPRQSEDVLDIDLDSFLPPCLTGQMHAGGNNASTKEGEER